MADYIRSLISLSCFCSFVIPFLKHDSKLKKYVSFSVSVVTVCAVLMPIYNIVSTIKGGPSNFDLPQAGTETAALIDLNRWTLRVADEQLRVSLCSIAQHKFDIPLQDENISIEYDTEDMENVRISRVTVDLTGVIVIKDARELESYLSDLLLCECEVKVL